MLKFFKLFNKKKNLELLYGLCRAGNNYKQDIHRDSDQRIIVFLLYLNDSTKDSIGGNLDIYKQINKIKDIEKPDLDSLKKIESIKPSKGKLILFKNEDNSYHGVEVMKGFKNYRNFIYGAFTLLNGKNTFISKHEIPTENYLY